MRMMGFTTECGMVPVGIMGTTMPITQAIMLGAGTTIMVAPTIGAITIIGIEEVIMAVEDTTEVVTTAADITAAGVTKNLKEQDRFLFLI
jgi:hypothetical protein